MSEQITVVLGRSLDVASDPAQQRALTELTSRWRSQLPNNHDVQGDTKAL